MEREKIAKFIELSLIPIEILSRCSFKKRKDIWLLYILFAANAVLTVCSRIYVLLDG